MTTNTIIIDNGLTNTLVVATADSMRTIVIQATSTLQIITVGIAGATGAGMPIGGTTGQVAVKSSNTDYNIGWLTLGTASSHAASDFATSVQGGKADSALQPTAIGTSVQAYNTTLTSWAGKTVPSGNVVGTSDTQTLTNKSINASQLTGTLQAGLIAANTITNTMLAGSITASKLPSDISYINISETRTNNINMNGYDVVNACLIGDSRQLIDWTGDTSTMDLMQGDIIIHAYSNLTLRFMVGGIPPYVTASITRNVFIQNNVGSSYNIAFASSMYLAGGVHPTPTSNNNAYDIYEITTTDSGSTYFWTQKYTNMQLIVPTDTILHLDATNVAGTGSLPSDGPLAMWADLSGNGFHAYQDNDDAKPYFSSSSLYSMPGVTFDGLAMFMHVNSAMISSLSDEITIYIVQVVISESSSSVLCGSPDDTSHRLNIHLPYADGTIYWDYGNISGNGRSAVNWGANTGEIHVWAFTSSTNTNQMIIYRDGFAIDTENHSEPFSSSAALNIGSGDGTFYFNAIISEIIIKKTLDSIGTVSSVSSALYAKWQTQ